MAGEWRVRAIEPGTPEFADAKELRYRELYAALGLPRTLVEDTPEDPDYAHLAVFDGERVVGYARFSLRNGESRVNQVCVDRNYRMRGAATSLMRDAIERARRANRAEVLLDARVTAIGFYERLGFIVEGEEFLSPRTHTPHRAMRLSFK